MNIHPPNFMKYKIIIEFSIINPGNGRHHKRKVLQTEGTGRVGTTKGHDSPKRKGKTKH